MPERRGRDARSPCRPGRPPRAAPGPCRPRRTARAARWPRPAPGRVRREPVDGGADRERALGAERGRVVVGGGRPAVAPMVGRQPPPRGRRGRSGPGSTGWPASARARRRWPSRRRSRRRARPTGRRAGRRPGPGSRRASRLMRPPPSRTSRRGTRPRTRARCRAAATTSARTCSASRRTSVAVPFWSLTMKLACFSDTTAPPIRRPLRPAASMSRPAESPGRVAEDAAGGRQPERLVGLAPAADVVEAAP